jgi:hypothetical protein
MNIGGAAFVSGQKNPMYGESTCEGLCKIKVFRRKE